MVKYNEKLLKKLAIEFWRVVDKVLTKKQSQVIYLYIEGYNKAEIANMLNISKNSVSKKLNNKKIKSLLENDKKIQKIILKLKAR